MFNELTVIGVSNVNCSIRCLNCSRIAEFAFKYPAVLSPLHKPVLLHKPFTFKLILIYSAFQVLDVNILRG